MHTAFEAAIRVIRACASGRKQRTGPNWGMSTAAEQKHKYEVANKTAHGIAWSAVDLRRAKTGEVGPVGSIASGRGVACCRTAEHRRLRPQSVADRSKSGSMRRLPRMFPR